MKIKLLITLFFLTSYFSNAQVVINEFDADNPGSNDYQIVELKTPLANTSLDGYVLSTCFFRGNEISFKTIHAQDVLNQIKILSLRP